MSPIDRAYFRIRIYVRSSILSLCITVLYLNVNIFDVSTDFLFVIVVGTNYLNSSRILELDNRFILYCNILLFILSRSIVNSFSCVSFFHAIRLKKKKKWLCKTTTRCELVSLRFCQQHKVRCRHVVDKLRHLRRRFFVPGRYRVNHCPIILFTDCTPSVINHGKIMFR